MMGSNSILSLLWREKQFLFPWLFTVQTSLKDSSGTKEVIASALGCCPEKPWRMAPQHREK